MRKLLLFIIAILSLSCSLTAQERTDSAVADDGGPLVVSIVACDPGPDVYELCGHAALRIRNARMDSVWNYGIFDFDSPNFLYRFCKGRTDYMVCGYNFSRFMPTYLRRGSKVTEQVLDLTQEEARNLRRRLQIEALPGNRVYRYNYVRDNCATRPWKRIKEAVASGGRTIVMPDTLFFPTFREEMKYFHRNYPWYQFGIDLALGIGLDRRIDGDDDTFAPPVLSEKIAQATVGGRPLVRETNVIFPGFGDVTLPPAPWYLTPMAAGVALLLLSVAAWAFALFTDRRWRWLVSAYFILTGVAGFVVAFLVFCSEHEATSPNMLIFWLNPFQLILGVGIWFRSWRGAVRFMARYNEVAATVLAATGFAQFFTSTPGLLQVINTAAIPMIAAAVPLAACALIFTRKSTLENNLTIDK